MVNGSLVRDAFPLPSASIQISSENADRKMSLPVTHRGLVAVFSESHEACRGTHRHRCNRYGRVRTMDKTLFPLENIVNDDVVACYIYDSGLI